MPDNGPYADERDAAAAARAVIAPRPGWSILLGNQRAQLLRAALALHGVETGDWDERVVEFLAGWSDAQCQAVAGWIARAFETGRQPEPGTVTKWGVRAPGDNFVYQRADEEHASLREDEDHGR